MSPRRKTPNSTAGRKEAGLPPQGLPVPPPLPLPVLTCPYTGIPQQVVLDDTQGRMFGWHLSCGLDLTIPFFTAEEALAACPGAIDRYTGETLDLVEERGLFGFPDAFSPSKRFLTEQLAWYHGSRRDGVFRTSKPPTITIRTLECPEPSPFEDRKRAPDLTPLVEEIIERTDLT